MLKYTITKCNILENSLKLLWKLQDTLINKLLELLKLSFSNGYIFHNFLVPDIYLPSPAVKN